jgi:hypothetical protein
MVLKADAKDKVLSELLALVDAILGSARENLAITELGIQIEGDMIKVGDVSRARVRQVAAHPGPLRGKVAGRPLVS